MGRGHYFHFNTGLRALIAGLLALVPSCGPPREDKSSTNINFVSATTMQTSGTVNTSEIGGQGLRVATAYQNSVEVGVDRTFSAKVSMYGVQVLFVLDSNGETRGLALSIPRSGGPTVDARSTALGLLFLSPGISTVDPMQVRVRVDELQALSSFTPLLEFLAGNLGTSPLGEIAQGDVLPRLIEACLNEWLIHHPLPPPDPSVMAVESFPNPSNSTEPPKRSAQVGAVRLTLPSVPPNSPNVPLVLENFGWRHARVYKIERDELNLIYGAALVGSGNLLRGVDPINLGSLFTGSVGQTPSTPEVLEIPSTVYKTQLWFVGPGMGLGVQLPDELQQDTSGMSEMNANQRSLLALTVWDYTALPILCLATGLDPRDIESVVKDLSSLFDGNLMDIDVLRTPGVTLQRATGVLANVVPVLLFTVGNVLGLSGMPAVLNAASQVATPPTYAIAANWHITAPHVSMIEVTKAGIQFSAPQYVASRAEGMGLVTVNRVGNTNLQEAVQFLSADGSAKEGIDYRAVAGTLVFNPGEKTKTIAIPLLSNPTNKQDATVDVSLHLPSGRTSLGTPSTATVTIKGALSPVADNGSQAVVVLSKQTNLALAIGAIGFNVPTTLLIDSVGVVTRDVVVPANVTLQFGGPGQLSVASGATVTIEGRVDASLHQIFTGAGSVVFGAGYKSDIYPQWWGAAFDVVTDDSAAWQAAINAASPGSRVVISGISAIGAAGVLIDNKTDFTLDGQGRGGIKVVGVPQRRISTFGSTVVAVTRVTNARISGLTIDGNELPANLIGMFQGIRSEISDNTTSGGGVNAAIVTAGGTKNRILRNVVRSTIGAARGYWIGNANLVEREEDVLVSGNQAYNIPASCYAIITLRGWFERNLCDTTIGVGSGFAISAAPAPLNSTTMTVFVGNVARRTVWDGFQSDSAGASRTVNITLEGNVSEENGRSGFYVVKADQWTLRGNVARNNRSRSIIFESSSNITLINNDFP